MKKHAPAALLATIVVLLGAAGLALAFGGLGNGDSKAKPKAAITAPAASSDCVTLETSKNKVCTADVSAIAAEVAACIPKNGAAACAQSLNSSLVNACLSAGYKQLPCTKDAVRITAVIEAKLTGKSVTTVLAPYAASISQNG